MLETWRGPQVEEIPKGSGKEKIFGVRRRQELKAFGELPERAYTALPQSKKDFVDFP